MGMDKYDILEKIGEGSYGTVFKAKVKTTGQVVALKKTSPQTTEEGFPASTLREIANLKLLARGENIVKLLAVEMAKNAKGKLVLYMVFEFMHCDLMDLYRKYSTNNEPMPPVVIKNLMFQLLRGVEYCHKHGVIHRDLKPQNLLLDLRAGLLKVADLGLGRVQRKKFKWYTDEVATLWYRPPELLLGETNYSFALDIWAIGCIFAELCNLKPLFEGDSQLSQLIIIFQTLGTPNEDVWPGISRLEHWNPLFPKFRPKDLANEIPSLDECGLDLLSKMLQYDPSKRIPARNALSHPYFFELQGQVLEEKPSLNL